MMRNKSWEWKNRVRIWFGYRAVPRGCCTKKGNLSENVSITDTNMTVRFCQKCGAKHYEMVLDPGKIGLTFAKAG